LPPVLLVCCPLTPNVDFAVGAPYEVVGKSTGVVYIYYGNSNLTLFHEQTPGRVSSQAIADSLEDVDHLKVFGFSLAGLDFDKNQYTDMAIGVFDSAAVVLLR
jgi:hypothetical protein